MDKIGFYVQCKLPEFHCKIVGEIFFLSWLHGILTVRNDAGVNVLL